MLLKNDPVRPGHPSLPVLPLAPGMTIAAVGPQATATGSLLSNYHGAAPPDNSTERVVSPAQALANLGFNVTVELGCGINDHGNVNWCCAVILCDGVMRW